MLPAVNPLLPSSPSAISTPGEILRRHRDRARVWSYIQILIVISIVATGAGLHVAAYVIEGTAKITMVAAVLSVAIPVGCFVGLMYALSSYRGD